jgi:hypothetical protein
VVVDEDILRLAGVLGIVRKVPGLAAQARMDKSPVDFG